MVAVHGSGYCTSAFRAAKLILNNILRIAAVNVVGDALLWLGKVSQAESIKLQGCMLVKQEQCCMHQCTMASMQTCSWQMYSRLLVLHKVFRP